MESRRVDDATLAVVCLLVASNVVANTVLPPEAYVLWNLAMAGATVSVALGRGGLTPSAIGLDPTRAGSGLRWGVCAASVVVGSIEVAVRHPRGSPWFADERGRRPGREVAKRVVVDVPLGTALCEEVAFRGVLPALLEQRPGWTHRRSVAASGALFGLWHVLPSLDLTGQNPALRRRSNRITPVLASVATTTAAALAFSWLRDRSGSVLAPVVAHAAINGAAFVGAWRTVGRLAEEQNRR